MSLTKLDICCKCPEHQSPYRNELGWILTGLPDNPSTWEAWEPNDWRAHCVRYATQHLVPIPVREEIARRSWAGESSVELAEEYGITPRTVLRYRKRYGTAAA
jgi:hypothetical protein